METGLRRGKNFLPGGKLISDCFTRRECSNILRKSGGVVWAKVIPLTSREKTGNWYLEFTFQGKRENAVLSQLRMVGVERMQRLMGKLNDTDFLRVLSAVKKKLRL